MLVLEVRPRWWGGCGRWRTAWPCASSRVPPSLSSRLESEYLFRAELLDQSCFFPSISVPMSASWCSPSRGGGRRYRGWCLRQVACALATCRLVRAGCGVGDFDDPVQPEASSASSNASSTVFTRPAGTRASVSRPNPARRPAWCSWRTRAPHGGVAGSRTLDALSRESAVGCEAGNPEDVGQRRELPVVAHGDANVPVGRRSTSRTARCSGARCPSALGDSPVTIVLDAWFTSAASSDDSRFTSTRCPCPVRSARAERRQDARRPR